LFCAGMPARAGVWGMYRCPRTVEAYPRVGSVSRGHLTVRGNGPKARGLLLERGGQDPLAMRMKAVNHEPMNRPRGTPQGGEEVRRFPSSFSSLALIEPYFTRVDPQRAQAGSTPKGPCHSGCCVATEYAEQDKAGARGACHAGPGPMALLGRNPAGAPPSRTPKGKGGGQRSLD
jgi:hypothetical protein